MLIFKVAKEFENFFKNANQEAINQLNHLRVAARDLYSVKERWMHLVGAYEEDKALSSLEIINKVSLQYLHTAQTYGLSASQSVGYYTQLQKAADELSSLPIEGGKSDQIASEKLSAFKSALAGMVPVSISPNKPAQVMPEMIITPGEEGEGNAEEQDQWNPSSPDYFLKNPQ